MTEEYHHDEQGRARIILPPQGLGKIIQVKVKEPEDWLSVGGSAEKFHIELFREILERFGLGYDGTDVDRNRKKMIKPSKEGINYVLLNAGKTRREGNEIFFGGFSMDYPQFFDENILNSILPHIPDTIKFISDENIF